MRRALVMTTLLLVSCATSEVADEAFAANEAAPLTPMRSSAQDRQPQAQVLDASVPEAPPARMPGGRPAGVSLCYTETSSLHPATTQHWEVMRRGDLMARSAMLGALKAAVKSFPQEEELALLLGLASLWRVAEPTLLDSLDVFGTLDAMQTAPAR